MKKKNDAVAVVELSDGWRRWLSPVWYEVLLKIWTQRIRFAWWFAFRATPADRQRELMRRQLSAFCSACEYYAFSRKRRNTRGVDAALAGGWRSWRTLRRLSPEEYLELSVLMAKIQHCSLEQALGQMGVDANVTGVTLEERIEAVHQMDAYLSQSLTRV